MSLKIKKGRKKKEGNLILVLTCVESGNRTGSYNGNVNVPGIALLFGEWRWRA